MFRGRVESWNLRDRHMAEALDGLVAYLDRGDRGPGGAKVVLWAHNSHLGDARATWMGAEGALNVGQLVRERDGRDAVLVGFTTHHGSVTAAADWGAPAERKYLPETERASHYFEARLAEQFNALLHFDETRTLEPLERTAGWERGEAPDTYPFSV